MARVLSTNHTSFTVSDVRRTVAYLTEGLGLEATSVEARDAAVIQAITGVDGAAVTIAYVRGPGHSLELIEYSAPPERTRVQPRPCDVGFAHVAYNVEGIDSLCARLATYHVRPLGPPVPVTNGPNAGKKAVYLRDWDGITIELIGH